MSDYDLWRDHLDRFGIAYEAHSDTLIVYPGHISLDDYHFLLAWESEGGMCTELAHLTVQFDRAGKFQLFSVRCP